MKHITQKLILAGSLVVTSVAMAEPFDGEKIMLCANQYASECVAGTDCTNVSPASVNLPDFFLIDTGKKLISAAPESASTSTTAIERVEHLDGKLMLQGAEDGREGGERDGVGWSMSVVEDSGNMVLTASGDGVAFVVFGACTSMD